MTLDEFFEALEKTPRDWRLDPQWTRQGTAVRIDGNVIQCPLTAVAGLDDLRLWQDAARKLGLKKADAQKIVNAADRHGTLRRRLLAACGLREEQIV